MSNIKTVKPNSSWLITDDSDNNKVGSITKSNGNSYLLRYQGLNRSLSKEQIIKSFGTQLFQLPNEKPKIAQTNIVLSLIHI